MLPPSDLLTGALVLAGSYPVNGEWTEDQVLVYELVLDLQTKGISMMQPGADYAKVSAELRSYYNKLLLKAGFVQGELSGLDANSISTYFCPHGFVHHVGAQHSPHRRHATHTHRELFTHTNLSLGSGLDVHDPGTIGTLKSGYTLTMEPGLYFMVRVRSSHAFVRFLLLMRRCVRVRACRMRCCDQR